MSEASCKAVICSAQCLDSIVVDSFRELADAASMLAANNQLSDDQLFDIIDLFTGFEKEVKRRKKADREARGRLKAILDL